MFNLIMGSAPDSPSGEDTISLGRVFEYTDDHIAKQFQRDSLPNLDELRKLPCLFMQEGTGNEIARIGIINHARIAGGKIIYEYALDADVAPLPNSTIYQNRIALDMSRDWEFSRHHWAIKDVDLYRFLLRNIRPRRPQPKVFHIPEYENIDECQVSAMMPFDERFQEVYASIQKAASLLRLNCQRADDIWQHHEVMRDVVALIDRSRIVVCDCSGRNPNVFYETGIAHTLGRDVILITQNESDIPFDLRHLRYINYLNNKEGRAALTAALQARMKTLLE